MTFLQLIAYSVVNVYIFGICVYYYQYYNLVVMIVRSFPYLRAI